MIPPCPECEVVHDDDFHAECAHDLHAWGDWHFASVGTHEIRFCGRCGVMEQQWIKED